MDHSEGRNRLRIVKGKIVTALAAGSTTQLATATTAVAMCALVAIGTANAVVAFQSHPHGLLLTWFCPFLVAVVLKAN